MNRRGFLTSLARATAAAWIAPFVPDILAESPLTVVPSRVFLDAKVGIAVRFIQQFEVRPQAPFTRLDVLYGVKGEPFTFDFSKLPPPPEGLIDFTGVAQSWADTIDRLVAEDVYGVKIKAS
jgi:hypothetical protein